jgi:hypothetical protein
MSTFTQTALQTLGPLSSTSESVALTLTGSPTVAFLSVNSPGASIAPNALASAFQNDLNAIFVQMGAAGVVCNPATALKLSTGIPQRVVLNGATYLAAVNGNGSTLAINLGTEA